MSTGPTNLYDLAHALLGAVEDSFRDDGVGLPEHREVTGVDVVGECEKLVVAFDRLFIGIPGFAETPQPVTKALTRVASFVVVLFRCVTTLEGEGQQILESPAVEDLDADAKVIMTDAYVLHRGIARAHFAGKFRDYCENISLGPATPVPTQGGIGGTTLVIAAELS